MKFLHLDEEQASMLVDAAACSIAFLEHRSKRIDPNGLLSAAAELQANKMLNIKAQLEEPAIPTWTGMHPMSRTSILNLCNLLITIDEPDELDHIWSKLMSAVVASRPSAQAEQEQSSDAH